MRRDHLAMLVAPLLSLFGWGLLHCSLPGSEESGHRSGDASSRALGRCLPTILGELTGSAPWGEISHLVGKPTRLATFPPVTHSTGLVILAAADPSESMSVLLVRVEDRLRADAGARDALAVTLPARLAEEWGVPFRTTWAEVSRSGGLRVIEVRGRFEPEVGEQGSVMVTWLPRRGRLHYVVVALSQPERERELKELSRHVLASVDGSI